MMRTVEHEPDGCSKRVRTRVRSSCFRWRICALHVQGRGEGREVRHGQRDPPASSSVEAKTMSKIRRRDTKLELRVRRELHRRGLRFRVDYGPAPGRPDIALTRATVSVFLDGCFWHGCPLHGTWPKSNTDWWKAKTGRTSSAMPGSANSLDRRDGSFSATGRMTTSTTSATKSSTCGGTSAGFRRFVVGHAKLMGS
ncbi:hypothetical protein [Corynebacterium xerosis]|uniref:hypothetical protein n=1 Tax=Corynebacterium xerosis TaxID=1725 RepID=UPI0030B8DE72